MQFSEFEKKGRVLQSQLFLQLEGVEHYCSLKETKEAEADVLMPKQVHGTCIVESGKWTVDNEEGKRKREKGKINDVEADAIISTTPGEWIGVRTADCVPVLVYDPKQKVVAAIHAGWRGTVKHIVRLTIEKMQQDYHCDPTDLYAMIGPSISPEAFEVGQEVVEEFRQAGREECIVKCQMSNDKCQLSNVKCQMSTQPIRPHIDLWQSNVMDLLEAGLELDHIDCTPLCTFQNSDILYSARKEGIGTGRIVSAIKMGN